MNRRSSRMGTLSVGWLFADLLLALAMIFLFANTPSIPLKAKKPPTPTPTPTTTATPTPTPVPLGLEQESHRFTITINSQGIISGSTDAQKSVKTQVDQQSILAGHKVGLVIAYGGAGPDNDDASINTATQIANDIYAILKNLSKQNPVFANAAYYKPLYYPYQDVNTVTIDIFFFKK